MQPYFINSMWKAKKPPGGGFMNAVLRWRYCAYLLATGP
jgi:hypothetical protein